MSAHWLSLAQKENFTERSADSSLFDNLKFPVIPLKRIIYPVRVTGRRGKTEFFSVVSGESALLADECVHFSGVSPGF